MNPAAPPASHGRYNRFADFYPFYLTEHSNRVCRRLHFIGTALAIVTVLVAVVTRNAWWLVATPLVGYGLAWVGHFFFEKNRPATFHHPWYSLAGDFTLFRDLLLRRMKF
jgi:hypothetical protein